MNKGVGVIEVLIGVCLVAATILGLIAGNRLQAGAFAIVLGAYVGAMTYYARK